MKDKVIVEQTKCDFCGKAGCYDHCNGCNKDVCWECKENKGIEFKHAVNFSGSGDGFYCNECLGKQEVINQPLYKAYKEIANLKGEYELWWKNFDERAKKAESCLKQLQGRS